MTVKSGFAIGSIVVTAGRNNNGFTYFSQKLGQTGGKGIRALR
jgi:hypothetical protein